MKTSIHRTLLLLLLIVGIVAPMFFVLKIAFTGYPGEPNEAAEIFNASLFQALWHTIELSALVVLLATAMALPLAVYSAWMTPRARRALELAIMVPFMTPPFVAALAWMDFVRKGGLADLILGATLGQSLRGAIFSVFGMALIMACELFPFLYLLLRNRLATLPASLIESAAISGASSALLQWRIIRPLLSGPFFLGALIVFVRAAGEFGTPVTLGNAIGYEVLVSRIYAAVTIDPLSFTAAAAGSTVLLGVGMTVWGLQQFLTRSEFQFPTRVSRSYRVAAKPGVRALFILHAAITLACSTVIPYVGVFVGAMTIMRSKPPTPDNLTFDYFGIVLSDPAALSALQHSAVLGLLGATAALLIGLGVVLTNFYAKHSKGTRVLDFLAISPETIPAIVLAIGFILLWNRFDGPPYNTPLIVLLAFAFLFLPMVVQNLKASIEQQTTSALEAARMSGASEWHIFVRILLPTLAPGAVAGWLLAFLVGIREVVMSSLLRPADYQLLSPWILNQFDQGNRANALAMTVVGVGASTIVLLLLDSRRKRQS